LHPSQRGRGAARERRRAKARKEALRCELET